MQVGLAISGGGAFFGLCFLYLSKRRPSLKREYLDLAGKLRILVFAGSGLFALAFLALYFYPKAILFAHEGIAVSRTINIITDGLSLTTLAAFIFIALNLYFIFIKKAGRLSLAAHYSATFFLVAFIMSFNNFVGWNGEQIFVGLHGIHSIWTIGAATVVDVLYLKTLTSPDSYQRSLYLFFPTITKFIWFGLLLDGISSVGIYMRHIHLDDRFFFMQTAYAILIINAVFLTRKIGDELTEEAKKGREVHPRLSLKAMILGSISIVSWYTITLTDFFEGLTLSYPTLLGIYFSVIAIAVIFGYFFEAKAEME